MSRYGCLGKRLGHSFSAEIHARLADYEYRLIELSEEELAPFLREKEFSAVNVTIPYKQAVIPYLDSVSEAAARIGAVNTVVNRGGRLFGYNTDYYGMRALIGRVGLCLRGKKVLILGTGGTSRTARAVAEDLGASQILSVSRRSAPPQISYGEAISEHADAAVIINTTPVGMYPDCEGVPLSLSGFSCLEGVVDAVYNPLRPSLVLDAAARGIPAEGGLYMLVMQAAAAVEKFLDTEIPAARVDSVFRDILLSKENVVLTGMPGSGKSTVGRLLAATGYEWIDTDAEIEARCGCPAGELIAARGEAYFRDIESEVIREVSREGGRVISTGGGAILREENVRCLKRNGRIFFLDADPARLQATASRPLSDTAEKLAALYARRMPLYRASADVVVPELGTPRATAEYIMAKRRERVE